jgi:16S rRNA (uracil1498-N3)-methyltransferase
MSPRFWLEPPLVPGVRELADSEAHHLRHVLRLTMGAEVEVFDGQGAVGRAEIVAVDKRVVRVRVDEVTTDPPLLPHLTWAVALPKGERVDWLVEKGTELGVARLVPLRTARSTVDPRAGKLDRLRQIVIAACKQSRRNTVMEIEPIQDWSTYAVQADSGGLKLMADPTGTPWAEWRSMIATSERVTVAIGPEGGWSPEELTAGIAAGWRVISLGGPILRIETAAVAVAALCVIGR